MKRLGSLAFLIRLVKCDLDIWEKVLLMVSLSLFPRGMGMCRLWCCLSLCESSEELVLVSLGGALLLLRCLNSGFELEPELVVRLLLPRSLWFCLIHLRKWFTSRLRPMVSFER